MYFTFVFNYYIVFLICSDDVLLGDEDLDYDLDKDEEDALLADDTYGEEHDNEEEQDDGAEEAEDILDLETTEVLDDNIEESYSSML